MLQSETLGRFPLREWELKDPDTGVRAFADLREGDEDGNFTPWEVKDGDDFNKVQSSLGQALVQRTLARLHHDDGRHVRSSLYYFTAGREEPHRIFEFLCRHVLNPRDYKRAVLCLKLEDTDPDGTIPKKISEWRADEA